MITGTCTQFCIALWYELPAIFEVLILQGFTTMAAVPTRRMVNIEYHVTIYRVHGDSSIGFGDKTSALILVNLFGAEVMPAGCTKRF